MIEELGLKDLYCKRCEDDTNGGRLGENRSRERDYHWIPWVLTLECKGDPFWFKKYENAKA